MPVENFDLLFQCIHRFEMVEFPLVQCALQVPTLLLQGFHYLGFGWFPQQMGFFNRQAYFVEMPLAMFLPPF
jgi:hypothetical protein